MFPAGTIQDQLKDWTTSPHDTKTKWNQLRETWFSYAKKKTINKDNALYEVVLQVKYLFRQDGV